MLANTLKQFDKLEESSNDDEFSYEGIADPFLRDDHGSEN